jgi:hypothetical protein
MTIEPEALLDDVHEVVEQLRLTAHGQDDEVVIRWTRLSDERRENVAFLTMGMLAATFVMEAQRQRRDVDVLLNEVVPALLKFET